MTILETAAENNDPYPENVCPRCRADITGWRLWRFHYAPGDEPANRHNSPTPLPFTNACTDPALPQVCGWDRDALAARWMRREMLAGRSLL